MKKLFYFTYIVRSRKLKLTCALLLLLLVDELRAESSRYDFLRRLNDYFYAFMFLRYSLPTYT